MPFYCMITFTLLSKINLMVFSNLGLQEIRRWCSKPPLLGNIVQIGDKSGYSIYRSIKQIDQWKFYFELIPLGTKYTYIKAVALSPPERKDLSYVAPSLRASGALCKVRI